MPEIAYDDVYENGVRVARQQREISDAVIERRGAPQRLRIALTALVNWSQDAKSADDLTGMNAGQRIARQAVLEDRVAKLSKVVRDLLIASAMDEE